MIQHRSTISFILIVLVSLSLYAAGGKEVEPVIKEITDMQDKYATLPESIPAFCLLPAQATSAVPATLTTELDSQLARRLVAQGLIKPITMNKYLAANFLGKKAANPFALFRSMAEERYIVPLQGMCRPFIFRNESAYMLRLVFYPLKTVYPVEILRRFVLEEELPAVIDACLAEFAVRYFEERPNTAKKRVLISEFALEFRKLVELASGEFEFVSSPFIEQAGLTLKDGDDYFGSLLGYILSSTGMVETLRLADFREYVPSVVSASANADYIIKGRMQLTEQLCFFYIDVYDARSGRLAVSVKHPADNFSLPVLWNSFGQISLTVAETMFGKNVFQVVPTVSEAGRAFYYRNTLLCWDTLDYAFLPKGRHIIESADALNKTDIQHTYYIFFDTEQHVFSDRAGKYAWNLLDKKDGK